MASGRRRDEWDRFGLLLALVDQRVRWGEGPPPRKPLEWWPPGLADEDLREAQDRRPKMSIDDVKEMFRGVPGCGG